MTQYPNSMTLTGHMALCPLFRLPRTLRCLKIATCILLCSAFPFPAFGSDTTRSVEQPLSETLTLDGENDATLMIFPAKGNRLLVWIPSYATPTEATEYIAAQLQKLGVEVWFVDLLEARFLPKTGSSIYKIPNQDILKLVKRAQKGTNKTIYIYAEGRATIPVLRALRELQLSPDKLPRFGGVVLNSPNFLVETPDPGKKAQLMPVVSATNLPIYILQPEYTPRYWQLQQSVPALQQGGSDVFVQVLKKVRARLHFRPDATPEEQTMTQSFGKLIERGMRLLDSVNRKPRSVKARALAPVTIREGKKDRYLQEYTANPTPPPLKLQTLDGNTFDLKQLHNKVVLVNFWATWCPPCVHEMPSMQRLSEKLLGDPFTILGINIAEDKTTVAKFLQSKVNVEFPILLDSDGTAMRQWNVMAFPTSFVIGKNGKIRYALFGSIDWNTPEMINKFESLINEK